MVPLKKGKLWTFRCMSTSQNTVTQNSLILPICHALMLVNPKDPIIYLQRCANLNFFLLAILDPSTYNYQNVSLRYKHFKFVSSPLVFQLCSLVSLQRYTKALSSLQRASLVEKSRQKPLERKRVLNDVKFPHFDASLLSFYYLIYRLMLIQYGRL